ncbi:MAG: hypothetical protein O9292_07865 [Rhodobacteraceae bacterium]|nr:hypothetical protein [Paracoccaceae bacterium]MCZ8152289.1 hypothetical protein [Paracoccaceae bacterium]
MRKYLVLLALATTTLSGCMATPTERGLGGAVAGAAIADALDENMVAGAALGALAGAASCGLPGLPPCRRY